MEGCQKVPNSTFKVTFQCQKSWESFSIFFSLNNTSLGAHFLLLTFFDNINLGTHFFVKVEMILKGSLDSIPSPSPSVKIQIIGGKVCLR